MGTSSYIKEIWRGKDIYRILMNNECCRHTLRGQVLDLGSGANLASYHRLFRKTEDVKMMPFDLMADGAGRKEMKQIDFENDKLPLEDSSADIVLVFNLLEHIYDNSVLVKEIKRVLRDGGEVIGSVPFLVGYHADPHDYWRFTSESLKKIFLQSGFTSIKLKIIGRGPFTAAFSQIEFVLPRCLKFIFLPSVFLLDNLVLKLGKKLNREKFALGVFFTLNK